MSIPFSLGRRSSARGFFLGSLDESDVVPVLHRDLLDPVQQDRLAHPAEPEKDVTSVRAPLDDPC
jgi:hypothetical protein